MKYLKQLQINMYKARLTELYIERALNIARDKDTSDIDINIADYVNIIEELQEKIKDE